MSRVGNDKLIKYTNKNSGRHDFQIDLGIHLISYGIGLDWIGWEMRGQITCMGMHVCLATATSTASVSTDMPLVLRMLGRREQRRHPLLSANAALTVERWNAQLPVWILGLGVVTVECVTGCRKRVIARKRRNDQINQGWAV